MLYNLRYYLLERLCISPRNGDTEDINNEAAVSEVDNFYASVGTYAHRLYQQFAAANGGFNLKQGDLERLQPF